MDLVRNRSGGAVGAALAASLLAASAVAGTPGQGPAQQVIVKYRDAAGRVSSAAEIEARRHGVTLKHLRTLAGGGEVLRLHGARVSDAAVAALAAALARQPEVEYAEVDELLRPLLVPNDPRYSEQWHYFESAAGINLQPAWDFSTGSGQVVAVIDTGYRPHADLAANVIGGYDMIIDPFVANDGDGRDADARDPGDADDGSCGLDFGHAGYTSSWHGTHVAGTIAALTNNGSGVAGVAFGARVLPVRVLGRCGGHLSDVADGIRWAAGEPVAGTAVNANPARVLNLSLGGPGVCSATMQNAVNAARTRGAVVVAAAGNSGVDVSNANPANCAGVVAVAAVNRTGARASYSNFGALIDLAAPGGQFATPSVPDGNGVLSTSNDGSTGPGSDSEKFYQGTSMATPQVAGVAALMLGQTPALTPDDVEWLLKASTRGFPAACNQCGTGIVEAAKALRQFRFSDVADVSRSTEQISNEITVKAIAGSVSVTVAGTPGAVGVSYSKNGGPFVATPGTAVAGDRIRVRHISSAYFERAVGTRLTVGTVEDTFTSTTLSNQ